MAGINDIVIDPRIASLPLEGLPSYQPAEVPKRNLIAAGLSAGVDDLQGLFGAGIQAMGKLSKISPLEGLGRDISERNQAESEANGRPDLEIAPWKDGGSSFAPWLAYQLAKQVPQIATTLVGGAGVGAAAARAGLSVPANVAAAGARVPVIGSENLVRNLLGGTAVGYPMGVGAMYQEASNREKEGGGAATQGDAAAALAMGLPYAALDAMQPVALGAALKKGLQGNLLKRLGTGVGVGAVSEMPQEALQTAMEMSFRPDLPMAKKMENIVDAALTGAAVGGAFGAGSGIRRLRSGSGSQAGTEVIEQAVNEELGINPPTMPTIEDLAPRQNVTPFGGASNEDLTARLGNLEQLMGSGEQTSENSALRDRIRAELANRAPKPSPLAGADDNMLSRAEELLQAKIDTQRFTQKDVEDLRAVRAERATRAPQADMFANEPEQVAPGATEELQTAGERLAKLRAGITPEVENTQNDLKARLGYESKLIDRTRSRSEAEQVMKIEDDLRQGKSLNKPMTELATKYGLLDAKGKMRDLAADEDAALAKVDAAQAALKLKQTDENLRAVKAAQTEYNQIRTQRELVDDAAIMRAQIVEDDADVAATAEQIVARRTSARDVVAAQNAEAAAKAAEDERVWQEASDAQRMDFVKSNASRIVREREQRQAERNASPPANVQPQERVIPASSAAQREQAFEAARKAQGPMAQGLTPLSREQAFEAAQAQRGQQVAARMDRDFTEAQTQRAVETPIVIDSAQFTSPAQKTVADTFNRMTAAQQNALIDREEFGSLEAVQSYIGSANKQNAKKIQTLMAAAVNANPSVVTEAYARSTPKIAITNDEIKLARLTKLARTGSKQARQDANSALVDLRNANTSEELQAANSKAYKALIDHGAERMAFNVSTVSAGPPLNNVIFDREFARVMTRMSPDVRARTKVVDTVTQLPTGVTDMAAMRGLDPVNIRGVMNEGDIYIVRENMRSPADVQEIILHEVFGHIGTANLFGENRDAALASMFRRAGGLSGVRELARKNGVSNELEAYIQGDPLDDRAAADLMDELLSQAAGRNTGSLKTMLLEWVGRLKRVLVASLRKAGFNAAADRFDTVSNADMAATLYDMRRAAMNNAPTTTDTQFSVENPKSVPGATETVAKMSAWADQAHNAASKVPWREMNVKMRRLMLTASSVNHMSWLYDKVLPALKNYANSMRLRDTTAARFAQLFSVSYDKLTQLERYNPEAFNKVKQLMIYTEMDINPSKTWAEHGWLHKKSNAAELEQEVGKANEIVRSLRQTPFGAERVGNVYDQLVQTNETMFKAQSAVSLYRFIKTDPALSAALPGIKNPLPDYVNNAAFYSSPEKANTYWSGVIASQLEALHQHVKDTELAVAKLDPKEAEAQKLRVKPIAQRMVSIENTLAAMDKVPYFTLGRSGDYVVAFKMKRDEGGKDVDKTAQNAVIEGLAAKGFGGIQMSQASTVPSAFIRVENQDQQVSLQALVKSLEKAGHVSDVSVYNRRETTRNFEIDETALQNFISNLRAQYSDLSDDADAETRAQVNKLIAKAQDLWLDQLPDSSISKMLTTRKGIPGYSNDVVRNYAQHMRVASVSLAGLATSLDVQEALTDMRKDVQTAKRNGTAGPTVTQKQDILQEVLKREANHAMTTRVGLVDDFRAWTHAYFLGLSPAYALVNMTQVGVLLWPELSKRHGFVASAKAISKATPLMFKILAAAGKAGYDRSGAVGVSDAIITEDALAKDKSISAKDREFIMQVVNTGIIDLGSFSRELARASENRSDRWQDKTQRVASSFGYYTETASRLLAALSSRDLNGQKGDQKEMDYVTQVVEQSMLNYSSWNTARAAGRMGIAGPLTPIMTSFYTYNMQLIEKLYREFHRGFTERNTSPAERKEARRFLLAHLGAVTTVSGTLGLPAASMFAGAYDAIAGALGDEDEPQDIKTSWRNFLADTFGKEVGEVLSRGLFRQAGIDIAQRAGEGDIIPFTRLLTDKREFKDKWKDWAAQAAGSPFGMLAGMIEGAEELSKGNVMGGFEKALPVAFRSGVKAYQMTDKGYTDAKGNTIPLTPGATDVLAQALGFKPAEKAEYDEEAQLVRVRKGELVRAASNIRKNLVQAIEKGDKEDIKTWTAEAKRFDANQPAYAVLPGIGGTIQRRAAERARSQNMGVPLATNFKDQNTMGLLGFGNYAR